MRFLADHDLHIHSQISLCSAHPEQTPANILKYAKDNGFKHICLTDHYWNDELYGAENFGFYRVQNYSHIAKALPLPEDAAVHFHFGCETDMDMHMRIGVTPEDYDRMAFIIVPITHLHLVNFTTESADLSPVLRAFRYVSRFYALVESGLPAGKTGIAHLTCPLLDNRVRFGNLAVIGAIPDDVYADLFKKANVKNYGIELNFSLADMDEAQIDALLRPYRIAKDCGCRFYFGSDSHSPNGFVGKKEHFERVIDLLGLQETDKYKPFD